MTQDLTGKTIVVTGASSGLGLHCAKALAARGARVIAAVRNVEKGRQALAGAPGALDVLPLELADLASVRAFAARLAADLPHLDALLANAGVMAPPFGLTRDGFELQLGTNHLGHFALAAELYGLLAAAPAGRLVAVSSIAHRRGTLADLGAAPAPERYDAMRAYADSKLANLVFSLEAARRLSAAGSRVTAVAAHPGVTETPLFRDLGLMRLGARFLAMKPADGAAPLLEATTRPELPNGAYRGPTGFREIWGPPGEAVPSARAQDRALGEALWRWSEQAIGRSFAV